MILYRLEELSSSTTWVSWFSRKLDADDAAREADQLGHPWRLHRVQVDTTREGVADALQQSRDVDSAEALALPCELLARSKEVPCHGH